MAKKSKPILKLDRKAFLDFIIGDDDNGGLDQYDLLKTLKKKKVLTAEVLLEECQYIDTNSGAILNPKQIPDDLKQKEDNEDDESDFEVNIEDFKVVLVG